MDIEFPEDICWPYNGCGWWPKSITYNCDEDEIADISKQLSAVANNPNLTIISTTVVWYPENWEALSDIVNRPVEEIKIEYAEWLKEIEQRILEDEIEDAIKELL